MHLLAQRDALIWEGKMNISILSPKLEELDTECHYLSNAPGNLSCVYVQFCVGTRMMEDKSSD